MYGHPGEHLADELGYVRALLRRLLGERQVLRPRRNALGGMAVDESELEQFLEGVVPDLDDPVDLEIIRERIDERIVATRATGVRLPLDELTERLGLSELERDLVLVLLAPELDVAFERAYAASWDDFTRKRADVGFASNLVGRTGAERTQAALALLPGGVLAREGIVDLEPMGTRLEHGFQSRPVRLASRVVTFVLGTDLVDEVLAPFTTAIAPSATPADWIAEPKERDVLLAQLAVLGSPRGRAFVYGGAGCGKKLAVELGLAQHNRGRRLLRVDLAALGQSRDGMRALRREARLQNSAIYLDATRVDLDVAPGAPGLSIAALAAIDQPIVIGARAPIPKLLAELAGATEIRIGMPGPAAREAMWRRSLSAGVGEPAAIRDVARRFTLGAGAIATAAAVALDRSAGSLRREDLFAAARDQLAPQFTGLATRVTTSLGWDDIVLPAELTERLRDLARFAAQRQRVFGDWNFASKFPYGRGLTSLFYGPPGTGKTMVAAIIAADLGMELFRVDLSRMVSKWIGETEKNLARVFDEAEHGHAILLFDEADSLFAKRTEVKSSNDRNANLEVNYLLQRMEDFDGVTILTTNFEGGIDSAFKRRLRFRLEFPFPDEGARAELWQTMFPAEAQRASGIDWRELGARYALAGGNIKNAVLHAAFTAAHRGDRISDADLRASALLELREMGRLVAG